VLPPIPFPVPLKPVPALGLKVLLPAVPVPVPAPALHALQRRHSPVFSKTNTAVVVVVVCTWWHWKRKCTRRNLHQAWTGRQAMFQNNEMVVEDRERERRRRRRGDQAKQRGEESLYSGRWWRRWLRRRSRRWRPWPCCSGSRCWRPRSSARRRCPGCSTRRPAGWACSRRRPAGRTRSRSPSAAPPSAGPNGTRRNLPPRASESV
jgi:hypothetical protein